MAKIHLNTEATAALQQIIGRDYMMPIGGDVVTGDKGDEMIIVQYNYSEGGAECETLVITPDSIHAQHSCALGADGITSAVPECELSARPTQSFSLESLEDNTSTSRPADRAAVLAFIAATDSKEIKPNHRGALDQAKVAEFRKMMGL